MHVPGKGARWVCVGRGGEGDIKEFEKWLEGALAI
jgi:hypothetical protein